jgi:hypothetical protein
MGWSDPRTWSPGETVTAALMNAHVRDNLNALKDKAIVIQLGTPGGGVLTTGVKFYAEIPFSMTITGWTLVAAQVGSIQLDVWKDSYANFPPVVGDTIAGSEKPTLTGAQKAQDLTLTTWSGNLDAGDVLGINIDSVATIQSAILTLRGIPR